MDRYSFSDDSCETSNAFVPATMLLPPSWKMAPSSPGGPSGGDSRSIWDQLRDVQGINFLMLRLPPSATMDPSSHGAALWGGGDSTEPAAPCSTDPSDRAVLCSRT